MRGRLWLAIGFGASLSLLTILVSLNLPRGLRAEPTDHPIAAAFIGQPYTLGIEN
ncbi:unnamed protein product, partial [marine sediment metagenome]